MKKLFDEFRIEAAIQNIEINEIATIVDLCLQPGTRLSRLRNIATEIALTLKTKSLPIIKPITEEGIISLEFLNNNGTIMFNDHIEALEQSEFAIPLSLGIGRDGREFVADLHKMPHLLVAGETGSGKSIMLHAIINSIIEKDDDKVLYLIDPKRVEFSVYKKVKCVKKLGYDVKDARRIFENVEKEMMSRLNRFRRKKVSNIIEYREKKKMPFVIVVIDELASVINKQSRKELDPVLASLTQLGRAAGIHMVAATQRPSVDVVKGAIKANFPARISCKVSSKTDSRVILDKNGAETLCGEGDAIITSGRHDCFRFKGHFLDRKSIEARCLKHKGGWW